MPSRIPLPDSDDDLLAQCEVQTYRAGGKGGQHVNKTETAVRLIHLPSGIVATSQAERSQAQNKKQALASLRAKIQRANYRKPPRVPTKKSRAVKLRILKAKRIQGERKRLRGKPSADDQ
jgi:protein subunit release factor A